MPSERTTITLPAETLERLDAYVAQVQPKTSRSAVIDMAVRMFLVNPCPGDKGDS